MIPRLFGWLLVFQQRCSTARERLQTLHTPSRAPAALLRFKEDVRTPKDLAEFERLRKFCLEAKTPTTGKAVQPRSRPDATAGPNAGAGRLSELGERGAAAAGLVGLAPLLLVLALTVKITSPGPVLAVEDRLGRDGRRCRVYRFRTRLLPPRSSGDTPEMNRPSEDPGELMADSAGHALTRHSSIGRFLTQTRLDGLPQLWNVLRGDLSLRSVASISLARRPAAPRVAPNERFLS